MPPPIKRLLRAVLVLLVLAAAVLGVLAFRFLKRLDRIEPPATGKAAFHSPYWLYVPWSIGDRTTPVRILVLPNNTGTCDDDRAVHARKAMFRAWGMRAMAEELAVPLLIPCFPRPRSDWRVYTHALDRDTMTTEVAELKRLDRQLLAMIDDARTRVQQRTTRAVDTRVLITGFSASGMFANRFAVLHPERVLAVAAGSPGGWPIAPCRSWQGRALRYPVGIDDVGLLTGAPVDEARLKRVRTFVFQGSDDRNDSVAFDDGWDAPDRALVNELFGADLRARFDAAAAVWRSVMPDAMFRLYPGVGHARTAAMDHDVLAFFRAALDVP